MHILMSALQPGGGIRTFFRYIYGQAKFDDCHFTLIAPDHGLSEYLNEFLPEKRIELVEAAPSNSGFVKQIRMYLKTGDYQLVHSHGFSAGLLTELARTGLRTPHLMTAHDVFLSTQFYGFKGCLKQVVMDKLFRRISGIHTVTEDAKHNFLEFFPRVKKERVHDILHGIDTAYFSKSGDVRDLRAEFDLPDNTPLVGFFGRFMNQKGFRLLVDAIARIRESGLMEPVPHVITFGWGAFIREDYQYLRDKGLGDYFHQAEQTNDMAAALKGVDIVAMPSRCEACGLLAMEALAAGAPLIGSDCVGLREVLDGSPASVIPSGSAYSLSNTLVSDLGNLSARRSAFLKYQGTAVERFRIDRPARALRSLYDTLAG